MQAAIIWFEDGVKWFSSENIALSHLFPRSALKVLQFKCFQIYQCKINLLHLMFLLFFVFVFRATRKQKHWNDLKEDLQSLCPYDIDL